MNYSQFKKSTVEKTLNRYFLRIQKLEERLNEIKLDELRTKMAKEELDKVFINRQGKINNTPLIVIDVDLVNELRRQKRHIDARNLVNAFRQNCLSNKAQLANELNNQANLEYRTKRRRE